VGGEKTLSARWGWGVNGRMACRHVIRFVPIRVDVVLSGKYLKPIRPSSSQHNCWPRHGPPLDADTSPNPGSLPSRPHHWSFTFPSRKAHRNLRRKWYIPFFSYLSLQGKPTLTTPQSSPMIPQPLCGCWYSNNSRINSSSYYSHLPSSPSFSLSSKRRKVVLFSAHSSSPW